MSHPPLAPNPYPGPPSPAQPRKSSGLALASVMLGAIAVLLSWVPIVNNLAAIIALVGLGLGIPALVLARRGTHSGQGLAIAGLITSAFALVLIIATQALYSSVLDQMERSLDQELGSAPADAVAPAPAADVVPLGVPAQVGDYQVSVDAVQLDGDAAVAAANEFNEAPTGQYVIAQLTVTYTGAEEGTPGWDLSAVFHGTDARQYSDADCMAALADDAMEAPTLNPGGSDTFQFCMDVPPSAIPGGQLSVEPTMSFEDERVYYAVQ